jgi:hypothetical protein
MAMGQEQVPQAPQAPQEQPEQQGESSPEKLVESIGSNLTAFGQMVQQNAPDKVEEYGALVESFQNFIRSLQGGQPAQGQQPQAVPVQAGGGQQVPIQ